MLIKSGRERQARTGRYISNEHILRLHADTPLHKLNTNSSIGFSMKSSPLQTFVVFSQDRFLCTNISRRNEKPTAPQPLLTDTTKSTSSSINLFLEVTPTMSPASRDLTKIAGEALKPGPGTSKSANSDRVVVQVGDRRFTTLRGTLTSESTYFAARLSTRWDDREDDGSFFVDADPELFEHILRFCRSGIFPLFFNAAAAKFDYGKYAAVLGEARYFGVDRLERWISDQKYLKAIEIRRKVVVASDLQNDEGGPSAPTSSANTLVDLLPSWGYRRVYVCPRGIYVHRGDPDRCGQACEKSKMRAGGATYEDVPVLRGVMIHKTLVFDPTVCLDD